MNQVRKFAIGMSMLAADIILLACCLYFTVIIQKMEQVHPNLTLWFLLAAIAFILNLTLQKKQIRISTLCVCNMIWMILSAISVCLMFGSEPTNLFMKVFVCGVILVIEGHSCYLALMPFKTEHCVLFLDALVVVISLFLCGCELRHLTGVLPMQILCFVVIGYILAALIFLRTAPIDPDLASALSEKTDSNPTSDKPAVLSGSGISGRIRVFAALGAIVAASCILCALLSLKAGNATQNLWSLLLLLLKSLKNGLHMIGEKCTDFFSRFDTKTDTAAALPAQSSSAADADNEWIPVPDLPVWLPMTIGIAVLALAAFFVVRALLQLRQKKLMTARHTYQTVIVTRQSIASHRPSFLKRLQNKFHLLYRMYRQRKTPVGLAILARKKGNSIGVPMQKKETWHSYLKRLSAFGDTSTLLELAEFLKCYFYSERDITLSKEQYIKFVRSLKKMQK